MQTSAGVSISRILGKGFDEDVHFGETHKEKSPQPPQLEEGYKAWIDGSWRGQNEGGAGYLSGREYLDSVILTTGLHIGQKVIIFSNCNNLVKAIQGRQFDEERKVKNDIDYCISKLANFPHLSNSVAVLMMNELS